MSAFPFESDVRQLVELDLDHLGRATTFLMLGDADRPVLAIGARDEDRHGATDPVSELAVAVAAIPTAVAALVVPSRYRDLATDEVVGTTVVVTTLDRRGAAPRVQADVLPVRTTGGQVHLAPTSLPMELQASPVASLVLDAATTDPELEPLAALSALAAWGHVVMARAGGDGEDPGLPPPGSDATYRASRLARELERRHQPTAPAHLAPSRPAVATDLPDGFVPACPL